MHAVCHFQLAGTCLPSRAADCQPPFSLNRFRRNSKRIFQHKTVCLLSNSYFVQVGSEDIDSGEGSQSGEDEGSDKEDGNVGSERDREDGAEGSEQDEDEVGDLSWEAVMAAVQDGGSDVDDKDELEAVAAAVHSGQSDVEPVPLPAKALHGKPRKKFRTAVTGKHSKAVNQKFSKVGKRPRQT